jgi:hypothetical protein
MWERKRTMPTDTELSQTIATLRAELAAIKTSIEKEQSERQALAAVVLPAQAATQREANLNAEYFTQRLEELSNGNGEGADSAEYIQLIHGYQRLEKRTKSLGETMTSLLVLASRILDTLAGQTELIGKLIDRVVA